jgi:hypothetical protein
LRSDFRESAEFVVQTAKPRSISDARDVQIDLLFLTTFLFLFLAGFGPTIADPHFFEGSFGCADVMHSH